MKHCDDDDGQNLRVKTVRQIDRPSTPENAEADDHDERVQEETRQLEAEQITPEAVAYVLVEKHVNFLVLRVFSRNQVTPRT
jgi:hypothetical protein